jgi:putative FmdB family regulatory protein
MRVYDFECDGCGRTEEHFVRNSDIDTVVCKHCGMMAFRKITAVNFRLPGYDPAFPTTYDKWGNEATKRHQAADKKARDNGEM